MSVTPSQRDALEIESIIADIKIKNRRHSIEIWKFATILVGVGVVIGFGISQGIQGMSQQGENLVDYVVVEPQGWDGAASESVVPQQQGTSGFGEDSAKGKTQ